MHELYDLRRPRLSRALLKQFCAHLPEHDAILILNIDDPYLAYIEAYVAARRLGIDIPRPVRRRFVRALMQAMNGGITAEDPADRPDVEAAP